LRECILGIDAGGTSIKATLFTVGGQEIATESILVASRKVAPGRAERDLKDIDKALVILIQGLLQKSQINPHDIQVIAATRLATPTLVFDEVDVGIGGKTAAKVGNLLTELARNSQVLVVTHQPQVAGQADQHLHVEKQTDSDVTISKAYLLNREQRIDEIARMLGGHLITDSTRLAAADLLRG